MPTSSSDRLEIRFLNLDRSKDRLATFVQTNRHLSNATRVAAVDGDRLDAALLAKSGIITPDLLAPSYYSPAALGAAMSHLTMFDLAIKENRVITVAEDDAVFNYDFEWRASALLKELPADWDFVLWGFNFDVFATFDLIPGVSHCIAQFDEPKMRESTAHFQRSRITPQLFRLQWAFGLTCYSVSPKGAAEMKRRLLPLSPMILNVPEAKHAYPHATMFYTLGIDSHLNAIYSLTKSYVCFAPLVISKNEKSTSTIQTK